MKLALLIGAGVGYVLGARAGRERYEQILQITRKIRGSQTVQSTAGVLQAQITELKAKALGSVTAKIQSATHSRPNSSSTHGTSANGHIFTR